MSTVFLKMGVTDSHHHPRNLSPLKNYKDANININWKELELTRVLSLFHNPLLSLARKVSLRSGEKLGVIPHFYCRTGQIFNRKVKLMNFTDLSFL